MARLTGAPVGLSRPVLRAMVISLVIACAGCGSAGRPTATSAAPTVVAGEDFGSPQASGVQTSDGPAPLVVVAPADPMPCPSAEGSGSPGASPVAVPPGGPSDGPPMPPGGLPPGIPPPPLVPPEALDELNRLAGFSNDLDSPVKAGEDGQGVIYIGEKGVEEIGGYMDRVMDNLDWFWRSVLEDSGKGCAWEQPERNWVPVGGFEVGTCGAADASEPASYCGVPGTSRTAGEITVGQRWMYEDVYGRFGRHAEFAVASVLAHEMGHHMQDVIGYLRDTAPRRCCALGRLNIELHADCLSGMWAYSIFGRGEIDLATMTQAVRVAEDFADTPVPEDLKHRGHGTAEERRQWYLAGFDSGQMSACDGALKVQP